MNRGVLRQTESALPDLLLDLEQLVRCESPSADLAAVRRSAELIAVVGAKRLRDDPERIEIGGCSHLRWKFGSGANRVVILAHHDTVWPIGSWATRPWSNQDGIIRGPGTVDMKAGLVQAIHALAVLLDQGRSVDGVSLLVTGDEEIGSPTSRALIENEARGAAACFVLEGAGPGGALKTGRKGTSWYRIDIQGRAAHAGGEPEKGVNASDRTGASDSAGRRHGRTRAGYLGNAHRRRRRHHHEYRSGRGVAEHRCPGPHAGRAEPGTRGHAGPDGNPARRRTEGDGWAEPPADGGRVRVRPCSIGPWSSPGGTASASSPRRPSAAPPTATSPLGSVFRPSTASAPSAAALTRRASTSW